MRVPSDSNKTLTTTSLFANRDVSTAGSDARRCIWLDTLFTTTTVHNHALVVCKRCSGEINARKTLLNDVLFPLDGFLARLARLASLVPVLAVRQNHRRWVLCSARASVWACERTIGGGSCAACVRACVKASKSQGSIQCVRTVSESGEEQVQ